MLLAEVTNLEVLTDEKIKELRSTIEQVKDSIKCTIMECVTTPTDIYYGVTLTHQVLKLLNNTAIDDICLKIAIIMGEDSEEESKLSLRFYDSIPELNNNVFIEVNPC